MPGGYLFSRAVRREFLDLVCQGIPVIQAERVVGVSLNTGSCWWRESGAMKLRVNAWGCGGLANPGKVSTSGGKGHRLSLDERISIMRGLDGKLSYAEIGRLIGRDRSVIWREHQRHRNPDGDYHARMAHARAAQKACRPQDFKLKDNPLCALIEGWMDDGRSPKLIADMLAPDYPDDRQVRVSHETIYQSLYIQTRGSLRADLHKCLSTRRAARKPRGRYVSRGVYNGDEFSISDRPAEAADRAVPGHWEGDLILGPGGTSAIGTLVERSTRLTILLHLPTNHSAQAVATAMIEAMSELPEHLRRSITWDRGSEMAHWRDIQLQLGAPVYFCNPHSPCQRGSNKTPTGS